MTEKMQASVRQRRESLIVRCCLKAQLKQAAEIAKILRRLAGRGRSPLPKADKRPKGADHI